MKLRIAPKESHSAEDQYERAARRAMMKFEINDGADGSQRLLYYGRQCKKFGIVGQRGVDLVRSVLDIYPLPKEYTDAQILKRINDASVQEGEACTDDWTPPPCPAFVAEDAPVTEDYEKRIAEFAFNCKGVLADYIEHNLDTAKRPQPIYALAGAIALVSVLIGRKVKDDFGSRPNVQLICVGKTASGKDHARSLNTEILTATGNHDLLAPEEFTSDTAIYRTLAGHPCRIMHLDEFGRFLQAAQAKNSSHLAGVVTAMMKVYTSAGSPLFRPKSYANKKDNPDIEIAYPHITLMATSTPEAVYGGMGSATIEDGFLGRCLIFESSLQPRLCMNPDKAFPWGLRGFAETWRDMDEGNVMPTTDDAIGVFADAENEAHGKLVAGGKAAGLWGRFSQKARQLSMIDACSRCDDPRQTIEIDEQAAKWGCDLARLLTENMAVIADEWLSANQLESQVQAVLRMIRDEPGITQNKLTRRTQWLRASERSDIIETLVTSDQIRWEQKDSGRRKSHHFYPIQNVKAD